MQFLMKESSHNRFRNGYMEYNDDFRIKLHFWQCILSIKRIVLVDIDVCFELLLPNLAMQNHPFVRQYMEVILMHMFNSKPEKIWAKIQN